MTRQYIGARYVPKFFEGEGGSNTWAGSSVAYEALTVVTYLNNSYTSKKPVPAGVDISNTEYWVLTGAYNAQVEEYRSTVESYKESVDEYKEDVDILKLSAWLTPEQFGAIGDGVADDTVAFQAFIDAIIEQKTTGYLRGVYAISDTISITSGYFNLYGKSDQAKILMNTNNKPVFLFEEGHYISNIIFDSFQIYYANLQTSSLEGSAFKIMSDEGIYECSFTNISFYNVFYAFYTPDNHTTMWGCYLNNIKVWSCFAGVVKCLHISESLITFGAESL